MREKEEEGEDRTGQGRRRIGGTEGEEGGLKGF